MIRSASLALMVMGVLGLLLGILELDQALKGSVTAWFGTAILLAVAAGAFRAAWKLGRPPSSRGSVTGHIVLFETPMQERTLSHSPALTVRGARDAIERFIPLDDFQPLFGGYALWRAPSRPTPEIPGEALGVWGRRTCRRFRRILRERGASVEIRRAPGPAQSISRLVAQPGEREAQKTSGG